MGWQWKSVRMVSVLTLALWSSGGVPWAAGRALAQGEAPQSLAQGSLCPAPDQFRYITVRDAAYRSDFHLSNAVYNRHLHLSQRHHALAAQVLAHTATLTDSITDPLARTDLVSILVGTTGSDPSPLGQIVRHSWAVQQPELALGALAAIAPAVQGLEGEYGVLNSQRAMLVQLAAYYQQLGQPDAARPLLDQASALLDRLPGDGWGLGAAPIAQGYAALGDSETAIALLDTAHQRTLAMGAGNPQGRSDQSQSDILAALALAYGQAQALDTALAVLDTIPLVDVQASTLAQLLTSPAITPSPTQRATIERRVATLVTAPAPQGRATALATIHAALGQWPQARRWVNATANPEARLITLAELALLARDRATVEPLLTTFLTTFHNDLPLISTDRLLRGTVQRWLDQGREDLVTLLMQQLDPPRVVYDAVIMEVIEAASAAGKFDLALAAIASLEPGWENQLHAQAFLTLVRGYLQHGQITAALETLPRITNTPYLPYGAAAHIAVAQYYRHQGQPAAAQAYLSLSQQALASLAAATSTQVPLLGAIAVEWEALGQPAARQAALARAIAIAPSDTQAITTLANQLLQGEDPSLALALAPLLPAAMAPDFILGLAVNDLLPLGIEAPIVAALDQVQDAQVRVVLLTTLADFARAKGAIPQALGYLDQALGEAIALPGPDRVPYNDPSLPPRDPRDRGSLLGGIARRYGEMGQGSAARRVAAVLGDPGDRATLTQQLACYGG